MKRGPKKAAGVSHGSHDSNSSSDEHSLPRSPVDFDCLEKITHRAFFQALMMIDIANHQRGEVPKGEPKVGGHPSACASSQHILSAIHMVSRQPEDYFACKPHVSPLDHALNFNLQNFRYPGGKRFTMDESRTAMRNLRHLSERGEPVFQSYHAETDPDSFRYFPSGSVGIPPVNALYTALGYDFLKHHDHDLGEDPIFWCLMGDSEFREGSLAEAMPDAGERELSRVVWIVDYNRQNLDGTRISNEKAFEGSDADRMARIGRANGWDAIILKHGKLRQRVFAQTGGDELKRVLDQETSDFEFQSLLSANNSKLTRKWLKEKSSKLDGLLKKLSDAELQKTLLNLGGHDLETLVEVFQGLRNRADRKPALIIPYTIKGFRLECQAKSGNHSSLPEPSELEKMARELGLSSNDPFQDFPTSSSEYSWLRRRRDELNSGIDTVLERVSNRRKKFVDLGKQVAWPIDFNVTALKFNPVAHTQWMWGQVAAKLDRLARDKDTSGNVAPGPALVPADSEWKKVSKLFVTMAPDVGSSTNTSPNMNGKLYGDIEQPDFEALFGAKDAKAPDVMPNQSERTGHIRFEIAEGNCMSAAGSFGKFAYFTGIPLFPSMTIYDFFIKRALDQFYYNLYWHSSFVTMGTPCGVALAPEGAQHSWKSDFQIPNCVTWEPAFAKELEWILADVLRRHFTFDNASREAVLIRCVTKGLNQKDFLDNLRVQPRFAGQSDDAVYANIRPDVLAGGYHLIDRRNESDYRPGDNVIHLFAMGALVAEAIAASRLLFGRGICANVFVVTSPDLLLGNFAEEDHYRHLREGLSVDGSLHLSRQSEAERKIKNYSEWVALRGARIPILSVHDGEPGLLDNIGSIVGALHRTLAVRKTSKSGTTADVFKYHHLDAGSIVAAGEALLEEMAREEIVVHGDWVGGRGDEVDPRSR